MKKLKESLTLGELRVFYIFNDTIKCCFLDLIMPIITKMGQTLFTVSVCLLLMAFGKQQTKIAGIEALLNLGISSLFVYFLKKLFTRPRPFNTLSKINVFNRDMHDFSFPSGHTTAAFSIACILALNFTVLAPLFILIALCVGISRMYLGVHYPSDIVAGMTIGFIFSLIIFHLFTLLPAGL